MGKKDREDRHREKSRKRHKHHKSSRHRSEIPLIIKEESQQIVEEDVEIDVDYESRTQTPLLLNQTSSTQPDDDDNVDIEIEDFVLDNSAQTPSMEDDQNSDKLKKSAKKNDAVQTPISKPSTSSTSNSNSKKSKKRRESGTSSEEERWLTAIESGKLEQVEDVELRKMKDPKLMTARQRAMYDRNNDTECAPGFAETLIALPTGYKEKEKPQTAEEIQKAALKSLKRKQQADEKREKDKKKTMERLLKKQESKNRSSTRPKGAKDAQPVISYKNTLEGAFIHLPVGVEFPLRPQVAKEPPPRLLCGIPGCGQPKVYNCSKTNVPLCSFACYRKNVQTSKDIIC